MSVRFRGSVGVLRDWVSICVVMAVCVLSGCGKGTLPRALSSPNRSTMGCPGGSSPCSASVEVPQALVDGTDPATYGLPISCALTAGSEPMNFLTIPSQPWFGTAPSNGTIQPSTSTIISITSVNAASVSNRNIGTVTVTASGYSANNQMQIELSCDVAAGTCKVAFTCNVQTDPLPSGG